MSDLERISITIDKGLISEFDKYLDRVEYANRSEAVRDLIRDKLIKEDWKAGDKASLATLTLIYDPTQREIERKLFKVESDSPAKVLNEARVPVGATVNIRVLVLQGKARDIRAFADHMLGLKGVKHGELVMTQA